MCTVEDADFLARGFLDALGGVYTLLGLGGEAEKNRYYPRLIHERRALRHPELAAG